jgi:hypothetical protein
VRSSGYHYTGRYCCSQASRTRGGAVRALGLGVGFIGPLLVYPESNLRPLVAILITGPLGFSSPSTTATAACSTHATGCHFRSKRGNNSRTYTQGEGQWKPIQKR